MRKKEGYSSSKYSIGDISGAHIAASPIISQVPIPDESVSTVQNA